MARLSKRVSGEGGPRERAVKESRAEWDAVEQEPGHLGVLLAVPV